MVFPKNRAICQQEKVFSVVEVRQLVVDGLEKTIVVLRTKTAERGSVLPADELERDFRRRRGPPLHTEHYYMAATAQTFENGAARDGMRSDCPLIALLHWFETSVRRCVKDLESVIKDSARRLIFHVFTQWRDPRSSAVAGADHEL